MTRTASRCPGLAVAAATLLLGAAPACAPRPLPTPALAESAPIERRGGLATATDGTRIHWEAAGRGPALLLIHGLGGNHAVWFQQVAALAPTHTVVTLSQRGFAPSGGDRDRYDPRVLAGDALAVMDAAGIDRAVVVGQSMGGWTALAMARLAPVRVRGLVLADTLAGISDEELNAHMERVRDSAARLQQAPPPLGVHPSLAPSFSRDQPALAYLYQLLSTFGSPAPATIAGQLAAAKTPAAEVRRLRVPTLFVVGSEDRLFPPALVRRAASYVEGSRVVEVPGAGHSPYFEQPSAWNAQVTAFVDALPAN